MTLTINPDLSIKPSEAMRRGIAMPIWDGQVTGEFIEGAAWQSGFDPDWADTAQERVDNATKVRGCAIGALLLGRGLAPGVVLDISHEHLAGTSHSDYQHALGKISLDLAEQIIHLNDEEGHSIEDIACWLELNGL